MRKRVWAGLSLSRNLDKGRKAMFAMIRRCHELEVYNVHVQCHLFDALVKPVLNYGCEVWGPMLTSQGISHNPTSIGGEVEKLHLCFLHQCLGIRRSTAVAAIMHELGREPIAACWVRQAVRFWNKIQARPEGDLVKVAMRESCALARAGNQSWAAAFDKSIGSGYDCLAEGMPFLPEEEIMEAVTHTWWSKCRGVMPAIPEGPDQRIRSISDHMSRGFKVLTYFQWFATEADVPKHERWWFHVNDKERIHALAQYRLGSHWLEVERGRYTGVPRSQRICTCCSSGDRGDEVHLFQCQFHAVARQRVNHLFAQDVDWGKACDATIKRCMNAPAGNRQLWDDMAAFLLQCKRASLEHATQQEDDQ